MNKKKLLTGTLAGLMIFSNTVIASAAPSITSVAGNFDITAESSEDGFLKGFAEEEKSKLNEVLNLLKETYPGYYETVMVSDGIRLSENTTKNCVYCDLSTIYVTKAGLTEDTKVLMKEFADAAKTFEAIEEYGTSFKGIDFEEILAYTSPIDNTKDRVFCYSYVDGKFIETETAKDAFFDNFSIKYTSYNRENYYSLDNLAEKLNLSATYGANKEFTEYARLNGKTVKELPESIVMENDKLSLTMNLGIISESKSYINPKWLHIYYTCDITDKATGKTVFSLNDLYNDSYTEYDNYFYYSNGEVFINSVIYKHLTAGTELENIHINYINDNYYVLNTAESSFNDNFFKDFTNEERYKLVEALYLLYKNCPDYYEKAIRLANSITSSETQDSIAHVVLGTPIIYVSKDTVAIDGSSACGLAAALAHETQHLADYVSTGTTSERSAYAATLKVENALDFGTINSNISSLNLTLQFNRKANTDWY